MFSSVHLAFADEVESGPVGEPQSVATSEVIEESPPEEPQVEEVSEPPAAESVEVTNVVDESDEVADSSLSPESTPLPAEDVIESPAPDSSTEPEPEVVVEVPLATSTSEVPEVDSDQVEPTPSFNAVEELAGGDEDEQLEIVEYAEDEVSSSTATTTGEVFEMTNSVTSDTSFYQFSREECVRVADGSFYCGQADDEASETIEDGLFAAPDSDGDLEIFLRFDGVESQVTKNTVDDAAPYYDSRTHSIVWHRLTGDSYHIVAYDIESATEVQLSSQSENSMEPTRYGSRTVWQSWIDGNWEIVLHDDGVLSVLTDSDAHDVAPLVYEDYVLWNTTSGDGLQQISMYDLETREVTLIKDEDGLSVQNPRMVLVYETSNAEGDIITKGFDLKSRAVVPLSATPKSVPTEIPESDQTGETRALIQNKSSAKESEIVEVEPETGAAGTSTPPQVDDAAASSSPEVVVATTTVVSTGSSSVEVVNADIVIPPFESPTETPPVDLATLIEDVVIPPFTATTSE